ncbi:hypothetical protein HY604_02555 [Candidatus Peregrinibacteria bacterium]|nr:hypothetical protein [Candidatus Peregrinibacteria bacterium]
MKRLLPVLIIIVIIVGAVFLFKNCEPRKKADDSTTTTDSSSTLDENTDATIGENSDTLGSENALTTEQQAALETAKKINENFKNLSEEDQKKAFINANIDFTCLIYIDQKILEDTQRLKESIDAAYRKHDLPVNNDTLMMTILSKYENDQYVIDTVRNNSAPCANGNEPVYL